MFYSGRVWSSSDAFSAFIEMIVVFVLYFIDRVYFIDLRVLSHLGVVGKILFCHGVRFFLYVVELAFLLRIFASVLMRYWSVCCVIFWGLVST